MDMTRSSVAVSLAGIFLFSASACAGPLLPCLTSTQSANGQVLVTSNLGFDDPDEIHPRHVISSVYEVHRRFTELNWGLRLNGPNSYWASPFWKVELHRNAKSAFIACSYVLVPDDGEYLVFVGSNFGTDANALTIYHHRAHDPSLGPLVSQQGELVREIKRGEFQPSDSDPLASTITDQTPEWFAGGNFTFSPDQKTLSYQDRGGRKFDVDLRTGEVMHLK